MGLLKTENEVKIMHPSQNAQSLFIDLAFAQVGAIDIRNPNLNSTSIQTVRTLFAHKSLLALDPLFRKQLQCMNALFSKKVKLLHGAEAARLLAKQLAGLDQVLDFSAIQAQKR